MRRRGMLMTVVALAVIATMTVARAQGSGSETALRAAIEQETVRGDLKGAIAAYQKIVDSPAQSRASRAEALTRMAICYQKLGDAQAKPIFERVVREFGDQAAFADRARAALRDTRAARPNGELTISRVRTLKEPIDAISNDGSRSLETDWSTGNVLVRDLTTGEAHPITMQPTGTTGSTMEEWGEDAIFSPDGTQAAYTWCTTVVKATPTTKGTCDGYLRVSRVVDGVPEKPRVIYAGAKWTQPYDWSPDGRLIAALIMQPDRSSHIALITVSDGAVRNLVALRESEDPLQMAFSPDGHFLAYDSSHGVAQTAGNASDVFVIPVGGGEPRAVASEPSRELFVGWSPDGSQVLFTNEHDGTVDLNGVRVVDGQPQGRRGLVRAELGPVGIARVTPSGALYYTTQNGGGSHIETESFDFTTGTTITPPQPAGDASPGTNGAPTWSPDGSLLSYISRRSLAHHSTIVLRSMDNGASLEVRPDLTSFSQLHWGLDPNLVYTIGTNGRGKSGLFSIDLRTAKTTFLSEGVLTQLQVTADRRHARFVRAVGAASKSNLGESYQLVDRDLATGAEREIFSFNGRRMPAGIQLSPDGRRVYYRLPKEGASTPAPDSTLRERDLASGAERVLLEGRLGVIFLSPDGRYIAIPRNDPAGKWRAVTLVATTGEPGVRDLMRIESPSGLNFAAWAPDSRSVLLASAPAAAPGQNPTLESWWVPISNGARRRLPHYVANPMIHPDGKRLAFQVAGTEPRRYEVWAMDHFLPPASSK